MKIKFNLESEFKLNKEYSSLPGVFSLLNIQFRWSDKSIMIMFYLFGLGFTLGVEK